MATMVGETEEGKLVVVKVDDEGVLQVAQTAAAAAAVKASSVQATTILEKLDQIQADLQELKNSAK